MSAVAPPTRAESVRPPHAGGFDAVSLREAATRLFMDHCRTLRVPERQDGNVYFSHLRYDMTRQRTVAAVDIPAGCLTAIPCAHLVEVDDPDADPVGCTDAVYVQHTRLSISQRPFYVYLPAQMRGTRPTVHGVVPVAAGIRPADAHDPQPSGNVIFRQLSARYALQTVVNHFPPPAPSREGVTTPYDAVYRAPVWIVAVALRDIPAGDPLGSVLGVGSRWHGMCALTSRHPDAKLSGTVLSRSMFALCARIIKEHITQERLLHLERVVRRAGGRSPSAAEALSGLPTADVIEVMWSEWQRRFDVPASLKLFDRLLAHERLVRLDVLCAYGLQAFDAQAYEAATGTPWPRRYAPQPTCFAPYDQFLATHVAPVAAATTATNAPSSLYYPAAVTVAAQTPPFLSESAAIAPPPQTHTRDDEDMPDLSAVVDLEEMERWLRQDAHETVGTLDKSLFDFDTLSFLSHDSFLGMLQSPPGSA